MSTPDEGLSSGAQRPTDLRFVDGDAVPIEHVNVFSALLGLPTKSGPDSLQLTVGQARLPVVIGSELTQLVEGTGPVTLDVLVKGRYVLTRDRAEELMEILRGALAQYDAVAEQIAKEGPEEP